MTVTAAAVKAAALRVGFDLVGITDVSPTTHASHYRAWLDAGYHGSMEYLAREDAVARRLDINSAFPELRSAVVVALEYCNDTAPASDAPSRGIIAQYARGRDYHKVVKKRLLELLREVEALAGHALPLARASVDTAPVLERDLAQRAGLGWFGRN
ncbi:MAG TPA: QueG-associated DUF1730 domain-containing protein, partial [Longimicrobiales bacterium]|nr:QueG-associated DUF1730 domain-containing protein [Longimicrobiales bacterium]